MSSAAGPSHRPHSELFPRAALRILSAKGVEKKSCDVVLAVSHRVYWRVVNSDDASMPKSLFDFRNANSPELIRLDATASWDDVVERVKPHESDVTSLTVRGRLHGRARLASPNSDVKLVLSAANKEQRDKWLHELRLRVAPSDLLHQRARELAADDSTDSLSVDELTRRMNALLVGEVGEHRVADISGEARPSETVVDGPHNVRGRLALHDRLNKWAWVEKLNLHLSNLTGIVAKAVKVGFGKDSEGANTAQLVDAFSKIIPGGASSIFHLVVLGARVASMFAEASRGRKELPSFLVKVGELLECVTESVVPILQSPTSSKKGEHLLESNVFEVLVTIFDMMGEVEEQLLRSWRGQMFNADVVKKVESKLDTLRMKVMDVVLAKNVRLNAEDIRSLKRKRNDFEKSDPRPIPGLLPARPRKSAFFVGRTKELDQLKKIVQDYGSACITGYGGLGKSQLMAAFAEHAEVDGDVPGGIFWVVADGGASKVIESLAVLVERVKGTRIPEKERQNPMVVLAALKKVLYERNGRWLLCLDNVDNAGDAEVCGILEEVAAIAGPKVGNGWVLLTSRCGQPTLWNTMDECQNVVLRPLSVEDAVCVLWRYKNSIPSDRKADDVIAEAVRLLKVEDENEYRALHELCGYDWDRSLGGLPLALIHAGAYIRRLKYTFSEYLQLYREANGKMELAKIMINAPDVALEAEQRAIFTTWSISMRRLSEQARVTVQAMAMLGNGRITEDLVHGIIRRDREKEKDDVSSLRRTFKEVVLGELVYDSSILRGHDDEKSFEMHRLVRLFILGDLEQDKNILQNAFGKASLATHCCLGSALQNKGRGFASEPNNHTDDLFRFLPHSLTLVNYFNSCTIAVPDLSPVAQLHEFTAIYLRWVGRLKEAACVQENVLKLQKTIHGENSAHSDIARALFRLGIISREQGKLAKAEDTFRNCIAMLYSIHGKETEHREIAKAIRQLGNTLYVQGKLGEAEALYRKAHELLQTIRGRKTVHDDFSNSLYCLGNVCEERGKLREAEAMYRKALDIDCSVYGQDNPSNSKAASFARLGDVLRKQGNLEEAEASLRKSLDMRYSLYGREAVNSEISTSLHIFANVLVAQGKVDEAESVFQKSLDMRYLIHGRDAKHRDIAATLHNLGFILRLKGKLDEAEDKFRKSLEMFYSTHGESAVHNDIANSLNQLGIVFRKQGKLNASERKFWDALGMRYSIYGQDTAHLDIATTLTSIGIVFQCEKKLGEAEVMFRKSLDMKYTIHGCDSVHSDIVSTLRWLGIVLTAQQKHSNATEIYRKILKMMYASHGQDEPHYGTVEALYELGETLEEEGKVQEAAELFKKADEMESVLNEGTQ